MNETNLTHDTTTAPLSFDELRDLRASAVETHRETLEALLPNLRAQLIAGSLQRGQVEACQTFSAAVFALEVLPAVADEMAAAGVPAAVAADYADAVLFGSGGTTPLAAQSRRDARRELAKPLPELQRVLNELQRA
jgi:hypothetical protein